MIIHSHEEYLHKKEEADYLFDRTMGLSTEEIEGNPEVERFLILATALERYEEMHDV